MPQFLKSQKASVIFIVALTFVMLAGCTGMAIDYARAVLLRSELSSALDEAALAGGTEASSPNRNALIQEYFNVNLPANYMGATFTPLTIALDPTGKILNVSASATLPYSLFQVVNPHFISAVSSTQVTIETSGMELVLVMDNTGSMNDAAGGSQSKIQASQTAANTLLNTLYGADNNTANNLWVGLVPFTQAVNIGTSHPSWLSMASTDYGPVISASSNPHCPTYSGTAGTYTSSLPGCSYSNVTPTFSSTNWQGCVLARSSPYDITDAVPSTAIFQPYVTPSTGNSTGSNSGCTSSSVVDPWKCSGTTKKGNSTVTTTYYDYSYISADYAYKGPNMFCPQQPVQSMVAEKSTISAAINNMTAAGDTDIDLGLAWGWRMLSPNWRGLWGGEMNTNNLPLNYNTPLMNKVIILMTDGDNHFSPGNYTAYGYLSSGNLGSTNETTAENTLVSRTTTACNDMKAQGIIIYTIGLGTDISAAGQSLLQSCASNPAYYFASPTTDDLQTDFQEIGDSLNNLRISQ